MGPHAQDADGALFFEHLVDEPVLNVNSARIHPGEDDWSAIQETLYLQGIPGMADSLKEAAREDLDDALDDVEW